MWVLAFWFFICVLLVKSFSGLSFDVYNWKTVQFDSLSLSLSLSLSNFPTPLKERGAKKGTSGKEVKLIPVSKKTKKKKAWTLSQTSIDAFFLNSHCSAFSYPDEYWRS